MAEVEDSGPIIDASKALALGRRHLLVHDYSNAVNTLVQACELLVEQYGDGADELAEPYLFYGRALLGLAREESNVLGTGVPGSKDSDEDEAEEEDEEEDGNEDEKEEKSEDGESEEKSKEPEKQAESAQNDESKDQDSLKDKESAEVKIISDKSAKEDIATPGTSKMTSSDGCSAAQNGSFAENGETTVEANEDEDVDNLEVAWEVLELAKLIFMKQGQLGWKHLAEVHKLLGEVALEGGNAGGALTDFNACLELLQKIEPRDSRAIAEIHYQLGLANSFTNDYDTSIEQFQEATSILKTRIKELEQTTEPLDFADSFYSVEGEIKELRELLPEIEEKISDMKDAKQEACKLIIQGIRESGATSSATNGTDSSAPSGSSLTKPATDISHLIRKKRKSDESTSEESPCKKVSP